MKKKRLKKILLWIILSVLFIIFTLFLIRLFNYKEIDDVAPSIPCDEKYLGKSDILWVIPNFNNTNISGNKEWCAQILNLNKTLGLHGVTHEFNEFQTDRNQEYLDNGISMFEQCFGFKPDRFKPPQLNISKNNIQLIENNEMELMMNFHQITRKVYHCNDSDVIKNSVMDWI